MIRELVERNRRILEQGRRLIGTLSVETWRARVPELTEGSAGMHFRHLLEFYRCFLAGAQEEGAFTVDYDARQRDIRLEQEPDYAAETIEQICSSLERAAVNAVQGDARGDAKPPGLRTSAWPLANPEATVPTTVARELCYLLDHAIHHYAVIAVVLRAQGVRVEREFGVAPSTLRYWRTLEESEKA